MLRPNEMRSKLALAAAAFFLATTASAETYPDRPIRVVVSFSTGSASDVVARLVPDKMSPALGQAFVVENQPGAGGNIGTATIARAEPNGYNLLVTAPGPLAANKTLTKNLPYDPEQALEPITMLTTLPNVVVVSKNCRSPHCKSSSPMQRRGPTNSPTPRSASAAHSTLPGSCSSN
jgi:tripartite-type tricarboxylate transporter receptor subunit TctC